MEPKQNTKQPTKVYPNYAVLLNFVSGCIIKIKFDGHDQKVLHNAASTEAALVILEEKYGFRLCDCSWMTTTMDPELIEHKPAHDGPKSEFEAGV